MSYKNPSIFALLTIVLIIGTVLYRPEIQPPNPISTKQPVILFELARSAQQIRTLFVDKSKGPALPYIQKVQCLVWLDYAFIIIYTCFIVFFALEVKKVRPSLTINLAILAAIIVGLFDVLENIQLLDILDTVQKEPAAAFQPQLSYLSIFTWIKWEATVLVMLLFAPFLWVQRFLSKTLVIITFGVLILGIIALGERLFTADSLAWGEKFASSVLLTFFLFIVYVLVMRAKFIINKNH